MDFEIAQDKLFNFHKFVGAKKRVIQKEDAVFYSRDRLLFQFHGELIIIESIDQSFNDLHAYKKVLEHLQFQIR